MPSSTKPFAQMLYDVGLEPVYDHIKPPPHGPPPIAKYPGICKPPPLLDEARYTPLPLRITSPPDDYLHAAAARTVTGHLQSDMHLTGPTPSSKLSLDQEIMAKNDISPKDMMMVYLSLHPFRDSFEEEFRLRMYDQVKHLTAGLVCSTNNGRLYLQDIQPGTPAAKIHAWRSRLRGAWLIKINNTAVSTVKEMSEIFQQLALSKAASCTLLLAHSELKHGLVESGIP
jgi:uncharacterized ParB-like nuclease family protein